MGLFDRFKKKEKVDYTNLTVMDLEKGGMFDFEYTTWTIEEEYIYDWGNECFSKEFKINNGSETLFMSVEEDDEIEIALVKKIKPRSIKEDLPEIIIKNETPPTKLNYKSTDYLLDEERPGYFKGIDEDEEAWEELLSWDYYDARENYLLTVERWGDNSFEASYGRVIPESEITGVLPNPNKDVLN